MISALRGRCPRPLDDRGKPCYLLPGEDSNLGPPEPESGVLPTELPGKWGQSSKGRCPPGRSSVSDTKRLHDSSLFSANTGLIWNTLRESVILERLGIRFTSSTMTSSSSALTILSFQKGDSHHLLVRDRELTQRVAEGFQGLWTKAMKDLREIDFDPRGPAK